MASDEVQHKTLYVKRIFEEEADAEHGISMNQIIERLEQFDIKAERKSAYRDIEVLREFGYDIRLCQRNPVEYALIRRQFKLPELMFMADAVQSSKASTVRQSNALVTNIKLLASDHEGALLERRIHVFRSIKTKAESVFGRVDTINEPIRLRRKVEFTYYRRDADGGRLTIRDGRPHAVTPAGVAYADGFCYLTAWDDDRGNMVEYRLDRMGKARVSDCKAIRNAEIDHHVYDEDKCKYFGSFGGEEVTARRRGEGRQSRDRPGSFRRRSRVVQGG